MNNNAEIIPWLVYRGIGLDRQNREGLDEPGEGEEEREEDEQRELETED
jgi:hypothetical protein